MITDTLIENELINKRLIGNGIIPLDYHMPEYISAGFYTAHFAECFLSEPYCEGETDSYKWTIRRQDQLINLRIWHK